MAASGCLSQNPSKTAVPHLFQDVLNLVEQGLAPESLDVILLESHALVVQGLEVVLLVLLLPHLVEALLCVTPLLVLGLQPESNASVMLAVVY